MKRIRLLTAAAWLMSIAATWVDDAGQSASRPPDPPESATPSASVHRNLDLFSHSDNCIACHNNLSTEGGEDVSIGTMWRGTMMANSARDPYWQASVRRE